VQAGACDSLHSCCCIGVAELHMQGTHAIDLVHARFGKAENRFAQAWRHRATEKMHQFGAGIHIVAYDGYINAVGGGAGHDAEDQGMWAHKRKHSVRCGRCEQGR